MIMNRDTEEHCDAIWAQLPLIDKVALLTEAGFDLETETAGTPAVADEEIDPLTPQE